MDAKSPLFICDHRSELDRVETCQTCGSRGEQFGVYFCSLYQVECADRAARKNADGVRYRGCNTCDDCTGRDVASRKAAIHIEPKVATVWLPETSPPQNIAVDARAATLLDIAKAVSPDSTHVLVVTEQLEHLSSHAKSQLLQRWTPGTVTKCRRISTDDTLAPIFLVAVRDLDQIDSLPVIIIKSRLAR